MTDYSKVSINFVANLFSNSYIFFYLAASITYVLTYDFDINKSSHLTESYTLQIRSSVNIDYEMPHQPSLSRFSH